jgi:hypothetical protein
MLGIPTKAKDLRTTSENSQGKDIVKTRGGIRGIQAHGTGRVADANENAMFFLEVGS